LERREAIVVGRALSQLRRTQTICPAWKFAGLQFGELRNIEYPSEDALKHCSPGSYLFACVCHSVAESVHLSAV